MRTRLNYAFSLGCIGLALISPNVSRDRGGQRGFPRPAECITQADIDKAVVSLSQQYDEAQLGQNTLRKSAGLSLECRQRVVLAVTKAMDKPNLDISRHQAEANLWREGARLLGDLKATESLDLLLSHITMTDGGWRSTMIHQPALEGIIRMGPLAIPKLEGLLRNNDWETRHYSSYCIASIGGLSARQALQNAVPAESNACVKRFMLISIKRIDVKHGGVKPDHGEWARAFLCMS
jgi:hypothetical protein